ncbi:hypothetical protein JCM11491_001097 [Sporobolomyces phaffii]
MSSARPRVSAPPAVAAALDTLTTESQQRSDDPTRRAVSDEVQVNYLPHVERELKRVLERLGRLAANFSVPRDCQQIVGWCHMFLEVVDRTMQVPTDTRFHDSLFAYDYGPNVEAIHAMIDKVEEEVNAGRTRKEIVKEYSEAYLRRNLRLESVEVGRRLSFAAILDHYAEELETTGKVPKDFDSWVSRVKDHLGSENWNGQLWDLWRSRIVLLNMKNEFDHYLKVLQDEKKIAELGSARRLVQGWMKGTITSPGGDSKHSKHHCVVQSLGRRFVVSHRQRENYDLRLA